MRLRTDNRVDTPTVTGFDARLDAVARSLAAPMPRRRALTVFAAGLAAASAPAFLRPARARADATCAGNGPQCTGGGSPCCVDVKGGYRVPLGACTCPGGPSDPNAKCCRGACNDGSATVWCCDASERCGTGPRNCADVNPAPSEPNCVCDTIPATGRRETCCPPAYVCGSVCCANTEECAVESSLVFFTSKECKKKCPSRGQRRCPAGHCCDSTQTCCPNGCCNPPLECGVDGCVCPSGDQPCGVSKKQCCAKGEVCMGTRCAKPPPAPGFFNSLFDGFSGFKDTVSQTAGRGANKRRHLARLAGVPAEVDMALLQLSAVEALKGTAIAAFADRHTDRAYLRKVATPKPSLPALAPGPGLPQQAAASLTALLAAEAKAFALVLAAATSVARARGALSRKDVKRAKGHVAAAGRFATLAARALKPLPGLRAATATTLRGTGVAEVESRIAEEVAVQASVRDTGVPSDLRALLSRLGVTGDDLKRASFRLTGAPTPGGPVLIAPLADPGRAREVAGLATAMGRYATSARRKPLSYTKGGPARRPFVKGTK